MCRRFLVLSNVLLASSLSLFALAPLKGATIATEATADKRQTASISAESQNLTESEVKEISTNLTKLSNLLAENNVLWGDKIEAVKSAATDVADDIAMNTVLIEAQGEQIDALKKELKKTRFFADIGAAFGFEGEAVTYGAVADMGMKFGKGLIVKTGVQYMMGNFMDIKNVKWSLDNLTLSATVGWEW